MALNAERYTFTVETRGTTRAVNSSSLMVQMDGEHWLVGVARNLLRPVGRSFQMTYAAYGALCWSVASWKGVASGILDSKLADFSFQVEYLGEVIKQLLTDDLLPSSRPLDTWAQVAITLCAATKLLSIAAAPLCTPTVANM